VPEVATARICIGTSLELATSLHTKKVGEEDASYLAGATHFDMGLSSAQHRGLGQHHCRIGAP